MVNKVYHQYLHSCTVETNSAIKPRLLYQGNTLPGNMLHGRATCCWQQATCCPATCCLLPVTCCMYLGNMYMYSFVSMQTGNNFDDGNKQHVEDNKLPGQHVVWCKRGLISSYSSHFSYK